MDNTKVIEDGILLAKAIIRKRIIKTLEDTAMDLTNMTNAPVWTHNLQDSIGCGIYENGVLESFYIPDRIAEDPRSGSSGYPRQWRTDPSSAMPLFGVPIGVDKNETWWGHDQLFDMITSPPAEIKTSIGWALYYVAAMPYAQVIDRKEGFMAEELMNPLFLSHIRTV